MTDRKVLVENMTKATVTLVVRNSNFKRELKGEGAKVYIPFDIIYNGMSEPGVDVMFNQGYLRIADKQDRIDLGLEIGTEENTENVQTALSSKEMLEILKENSPIKVKETLNSLAEKQRIKFAQVAAENGIYTPGLAKLINDFTGLDLLKIMSDLKKEQEDNE